MTGFVILLVASTTIRYPIESVSDVQAPVLLRWLPARSGFFVFQRSTYGGAKMNLYSLEHGVVRKRFRDSRVHFALNCASRGRPRLPRSAFATGDLQAEFDRETNGKIVLSAIFDWYRDDFVQEYRRRYNLPDADLLDYVASYVDREKRSRLNAVREMYEVFFAPYDWRLNDVR